MRNLSQPSIGGSELTGSRFRHCPKSRGSPFRLSVWTWILLVVGAMLLLLLILGGVLAYRRNSKKGSSAIRKPVSERPPADEKGNTQLQCISVFVDRKFVSHTQTINDLILVINISSTREDPAAEPV